MSHRTILLIFLIPALGIAALLWQLAGAGEIRLSNVLFPIGLFVLAGMAISRRGRTSPRSSQIQTKVIGARVGDGVGELIVAASSSQELGSLRLPVGARIVTVIPHQSYKVEFALPPKTTPDLRSVRVYPEDGRSFDQVLKYSQRDADRNRVERVARANGYRGEVGQ